MLQERKLLEPIAAQLQSRCGETLWRSLGALDAYRRRFEATPESLTNAILLGSLIVPLGLGFGAAPPAVRHDREKPRREPAPTLGILQLPRRDIDRLRQILSLQRRLTDATLSPRARRALTHRGPFQDALTWLEIHGNAPEVLEHWRGFLEAAGAMEGPEDTAGIPPQRRRRRRRRRRPSPTPHTG